ncbi:MAG: methylenetetrahydrofolate--tRNA-(uracil(54)-C(5))-methyltransferase (FADH(2)-oxidizing) TrmFO [Pseudomonadota bacterium]
MMVIGGGLAGCEAAWRLATSGIRVRLHEMKPRRFSPAHHSADLAEMVCSNSFRSADASSAVGLLKAEMERLGSLVMAAARRTSVPAGRCLAVDRQLFAGLISRWIEAHPNIEVVRQEVTELPDDDAPVVVATGPLTSDALSAVLAGLAGAEHLFFYDAIAPVVYADSIDHTQVFWGSRYGAGNDYLNCPLSVGQYQNFLAALLSAERVPLARFEDEARHFEGCLPVEVLAERGPDTLRFGPMKPVGLIDPRTGCLPHAVVQLRKENLQGSLLNMVGFQTKLRHGEQERVFRLIPGLGEARFARLGSLHRNTFVKAPEVLLPTLQFKSRPAVFLAGQITGVEGYLESAAMGIWAGINAARLARGLPPAAPPATTTAMGALVAHISGQTLSAAGRRGFQPMNVNFGLFEPLGTRCSRRDRGSAYASRALQDLSGWMSDQNLQPAPEPAV